MFSCTMPKFHAITSHNVTMNKQNTAKAALAAQRAAAAERQRRYRERKAEAALSLQAEFEKLKKENDDLRKRIKSLNEELAEIKSSAAHKITSIFRK